MTYYEELGISADAAEEDIRQAHRRLVKLLHPDQQQDDQLRRMAELQLMRVNGMVELLADPKQRRVYDLSLVRPARMLEAKPVGSWKFGAAAGVVSIAAALGWFIASSRTEVARPLASRVIDSDVKPASPVAKIDVKPAPAPSRAPAPQMSTAPPPVSDLPVLASHAAPVSEAPPATHSSPTPAAVADTAPRETTASPERPTLAGVWLYAASGRKNDADPALYKPEYIELRIAEDGGVLRGDYRSRYAVTNLPISPAVNFAFQGLIFAIPATLPWKGPKGSSGAVTLKLLNRNALQVDWKVSNAGDSGIGLQFGTAVLVRRL